MILINTSQSFSLQILQGVNRVLSLLLLNPQQSIQDIHLTNYTILNCEPLHDVKGHLANLMEELPNLLQGSQKEKCNDILAARLGGKVSGADTRSTVIMLYILLQKEGTKQCILDLLHSIIKIQKFCIQTNKTEVQSNTLQQFMAPCGAMQRAPS